MSDLVDLFPGFGSHSATTEAGRIFARVGGSGPPLLLLHGFPQTGAMWHRIAPALAARYTVVVADLRGYGWSSAPRSDGGVAYTKRAMGLDVITLMEDLGHARFSLVGHDRGARVAYRLALDHPGRIDWLAVLDIVPTELAWRTRDANPEAYPHWPWLAGPAPGPEREIGQAPDRSFEGMMASWTGSGDLSPFDPRALAQYRAAWGDPTRIHAMCEDYRAGAAQDREADRQDLAAGRTIDCPVLVLAGRKLATPDGMTPLAAWRASFAPQATGLVLSCGHFVAEERPDDVLAALADHL